MGCPGYSFSKKERLGSKKKIEELFKTSSSFCLDSFRVQSLLSEEEIQYHLVLISVSKRNFKRAVDRNLIKRRIREAYRLNKHLLDDIPPLYLGLIYTSKNILTFHEIQNQLIRCMKRLKSINFD
ncbi:MAG: ribonuclease P protein component [Ekhidna sp.]|nr:ribonuclease P protein component [Ekhidna sp.]MBC6409351.1 ribonuclease P protein component [Ekhidna sp.]